MKKHDELAAWNQAKDYMGKERVTLGPHYTYVLRKLPRRLLFILSHYKFALKVIGPGKTILEVGCSEGFATNILAEEAKKVVAVDFDQDAIREAQASFSSEVISFRCADLMKRTIGRFDAVVAMDVIEHIYPRNEKAFFSSILRNLAPAGMAVIGTPNKTAAAYASPTSKISHVNLFTAERLRQAMARHFRQVILFSANDEVVHTGFYPMAHYLIAVGIAKR